MANRMASKIKFAMGAVAFLSSLLMIPLSGRTENQFVNESQTEAQNAPGSNAQINGRIVYVCARLKTKSCPCMTEAKMEGK